MTKRSRGRPRKIKSLEQYTISELRDMPMGSMVKLFVHNIVGKKSVVASSSKNHTSSKTISIVSPSKKNKIAEESFVASVMSEMTLEKKADYLADALMGYLKKSGR